MGSVRCDGLPHRRLMVFTVTTGMASVLPVDGRFAHGEEAGREVRDGVRLSLAGESGAGSQESVRGGEVRLAAIRDVPLSVEEVVSAVADPAAGGHAVFVGTVRDADGGKDVRALSYSAHPSATDVLRTVADRAATRPGVLAVAAVHRVGDLVIGDLAVVVAVSCAHRGEAFDACRALIDELKATVPIWKHQRFGDGTDEWVGSP